jgi:LPS-assembly protein
MQRCTSVLLLVFACVGLCLGLTASAARAQTPPPVPQLPAQQPPPPTVPPPVVSGQSQIGGCNKSEIHASLQDYLSKEFEGKTERVLVLTGTGALSVRVECDQTQFYAEFVEVYLDRNYIVATGNVTFVSNTSRISAERMEYDTKKRTGVFYVAHGWAAIGERVERSMFGTQEPDAQFTGKEIHKLGPQKYKVVQGAFSTCAQPTPRWQLVSREAVVNLDDYVLLKNTVLKVKNVPLFYAPIFYYPLEEDDRSTGFLIPMYGSSTLRGQTLSNAFFWAISRNQDATLEHDWYSKSGQQIGGEYRYVLQPGSQGTATVSLLNEKTQTTSGGTTTTTPGVRSYRIDGGMTQNMGAGFRARANANYFSSIANEQKYQQDLARATQSHRQFGGNITGNWREYVLSGTMDRIDYFDTNTASNRITTTGGLPRISFSRGERPIGKSQIYFGTNTDFSSIVRRVTDDETTLSDQGLSRFEVAPTIRVPFTRWPFFTVNSSVTWRGTFWNESLNSLGTQVPESLKRQYFDFNAQFVGPVFTRIFNANSEGGTKIKHIIQPVFGMQRVTGFDIFDSIVKLETSDFQVPGVFRFNYGLINRLYAKKDVARDVLSVSITQSRYSDSKAAALDPQYQNTFSTQTAVSKYSPLALVVRSSPNPRVETNFRTEWTPNGGAFQSFAGSASINTTNFQQGVIWAQQRVVPLDPLLPPTVSVHYLTSSTTLRSDRNKVGGTYAFSYDFHNTKYLQQRIFGYYNAQCCGILAEYQVFNLPSSPIPQDKRFNISFTLAGIGTFSNLLGAFGGQGR